MKEVEFTPKHEKIFKKPVSHSYSTNSSFRLRNTEKGMLVLKKTLGTTILAFTGILLSIFIVSTAYDYLVQSFHESWGKGVGLSIFFLLMISLWGGGGIGILWISSLKNEFDLNSKRYRKKEVNLEQWLKVTEYDVPFSDIKAIQVLEKESHSSDSDIICYELNIVLKNLKRINIVPHGSIDAIKEDAELIAEHLDIPVICQIKKL